MELIQGGRDLRIDFFRGLALWWIFTDHVPRDWLGLFSVRNFALCDATEIFVFLAGYAGGLAYGGTMRRQGWVFASADVVRRAWTLYVAHIFLFVVFAAQVGWSVTALDRSEYLDEIHLDVLGEAPYRALLMALLLHFQPAYLNILPLYVVLLLIFAALLPLLRWPVLLACLSFAGYVVTRALALNLPSWTGGGWFFNPFAWQFLFILGAALAYADPSMPTRRRTLDVLALAMVALGLAMQWLVWPHEELLRYLPAQLAALFTIDVDKGGLHPLRLLSILALVWLAIRLIPREAGWLRSRAAAPFVLAGQHSLPVFCAGIFLAFLGRVAMERNDGLSLQLLVNGLGALGLVGVAAVAAWYRWKSRRRPLPGAA